MEKIPDFILVTSILFAVLFEGRSESSMSESERGSKVPKNQNEPHSRQKRFVYFNTQSPVAVGVLITLPMTFILPTMNLKTSRRRRRSISWSTVSDSNQNNDYYYNQSILNNGLEEFSSEEILPLNSYDPPAYSIEISQLAKYFSLFEIDEDICRQKIICQIFSNTSEFEPLSSILLKKLTVDRGPIEEEKTNRYYRYVNSMQIGMSSADEPNEKCSKNLFSNSHSNICPYSADQVFDKGMLKLWKYVVDLLQIEIKDDI